MSPLFAGLLLSELDRVALVMDAVQVAAGEVVCSQGWHEFYVIASGAGGGRAEWPSSGRAPAWRRLWRAGIARPRASVGDRAHPHRHPLGVLKDESFAAVLNEVPVLAQKLLAALARGLRQAETAQTALLD